MHRIASILLSLTFILLVPVVLAQPQWQVTGTVDLTIAGEQSTYHTYSAHVAEDLASEVEGEEAKDFAQQVAGTEQHSATWMLLDAIKAGTIEITPPVIFVNVSARAEASPNAEEGQLDFSFPLDPTSLTRETAFDAEVTYYPESFGLSEFYALTQGTIEFDSVERAGERTLSISGSISGTLTFQQDSTLEHNPDQALPIEASFEVEQVVGSELLSELLSEELQ